MNPMESRAKTLRFLTLFLEGEHYGIEVERVREIVAWAKITRIPKAPPYIRGVMNLRGNIIPVLDLRARFSLPRREVDIFTSIVVVLVEGISLGLMVDRVDEVISVDEVHLSIPPHFGNKIDVSCLKQMAQGEFGVVAVLSLEAILSQEEWARLDNVPL